MRKPAGVTVSLEKITPEVAMQFLSQNPNNRHIVQNHVIVLSREMAMGDWHVTGQGITISDKGKLLDGQHRLLAVEDSGETIWMVVTRGIKKEAMNVIDTVARSRSAGDIFSMRGYKNAIALAAGINVLNKFSLNGRFNSLNHADSRLTQSQYDKHLEIFPQLKEWAHYQATLTEHVLYPSIIIGCGVVFGLAETEDGQARQFFWKLDSGEMLHKDEPIYQLRKHLLRFNANRKSFRVRPETVIFLLIKTWNAHVSGADFARLKISGRERMPLVIGFDPTVLPYFVATGQTDLKLD